MVTGISGGYQFVDGLFQAVSTRTAGTSVVDIANLHPSIQVSYLIMMYISVFPIAISMRRTNVYEEKSLGIYGSRYEEEDGLREPSYIGTHLMRQLGHDLWFIFTGLFVMGIAEGSRLQSGDPNFSLFACLFEIVSAYGTVGLSLGYPTINASLSAEFHVVSKLVIITMMIRGRHRGLPYELDRAILLPSESLHQKEDLDAAKRIDRRRSNASAFGPAFHHSNSTASAATAPPGFGYASPQTSAQEPQHTNATKHAHGMGSFMAALASATNMTRSNTASKRRSSD